MARQLILGLGAGQCGLELLVDILNRQPQTKITFQQMPLLSWVKPPGAPGMAERLVRLLATTRERFVGDVTPFYLPHMEEAIEREPTLRAICLKRPADEVVAGFLAALSRKPRTPIDHWSASLRPPFERDPIWSRTFPKYDVPTREAGIRRYWSEYYGRAEELAARFPQQFRVFDTEHLTTEAGVREVLSFCGFPGSDQVVLTGRRPQLKLGPDPGPPPHPFPNPLDPRRCVILVPFTGFIHQDCEQSLKELERRGYHVRRVGGYAAIDQGRNQMATDALAEGFEETFWIDSDVAFNPDDVDRLRRHSLPIVCGIYPQKGKRALACHVMFGIPSTEFGKTGGLIELLYAGTGFLLVRREVYLTIQERLNLPMTNERFGHPMLPFFLPMIRTIEESHWYLAEDYAFCQRARECGFKVYADTSVRLWHIGTYRYGWEDAGMDRPRFASFTLNFDERGRIDPPASDPASEPGFRELLERHPWPAEKPSVPTPPIRENGFQATRELLEKTVPREARLIVDLGADTGRSTRFLADHAPGSIVVAIDQWGKFGESPHDSASDPAADHAFDTFLSECWLYRDRLIPLQSEATEGMRELATAGQRPIVICVGSDHAEDSLRAVLSTAIDLFPGARVVGSDWDREGVRRIVEDICRDRRLACETNGSGWWVTPVGL
jgi:hypothetical protein